MDVLVIPMKIALRIYVHTFTRTLIVDHGWYQPLSRRPRRNRKSPALRASFQETNLSPANFVYPLFIHEGW